MNITDIRDAITTAKDNGEHVLVSLSDGTTVSGAPISVNTKGVNIKVDDKTRSFSLNRVRHIDLVTEDDTDEEIYAMLGEGMTTTELADHLSDALAVTMTPKELRVHLRALGLGVGKGRKYSLSATEYRMVRDLVRTAS